ncbi:transcription factor EMB1444 isoform X2 [Typha angustifolia]|uniref:transcription factor EMB1444 isoform X2 n=1 Tax=Typha angustifolia TaxID=59011 RepID=UPI003C2E92BB
MGSDGVLGQMLRSLCCNSQWIYAVFWKLNHDGHGILTWENGYFENSKANFTAEALHPYYNPGMMSFSSDQDAQNGSYVQSLIEIAVSNMSCRQYSLGKGIVGQVALTGEHQWIFADESNSSLLFEDWQLQFAEGIKTILLVPIAHHGVLELGSLNVVLGDLTVATQIRDLFCSLYQISEAQNCLATSFDCSNSCKQHPIPLSVNPMDHPVGDLINLIQSQECSTTNTDSLPLFMVQNDFPLPKDATSQAFDDNVACYTDVVMKARQSDICVNPAKEPLLLSYSNKMLENDLASFFFLEDEIDILSHPNILDSKLCYEETKFYAGNAISQNEHDTALNFYVDSEPHKTLWKDSIKEHAGFSWDTALSEANVLDNSVSVFQAAGSEIYLPLIDEENKCFIRENITDYLLDPVMSNLDSVSEDACQSSTKISDCCLTQTKGEDRAPSYEDSVPVNQGKSVSVSLNDGFMRSAIDSLSSNICTLVKRKQRDGITYRDSDSKSFKRSQGRGSREFHRPRDRQLIQDRIKELRELIPSGSKCSIDTLLHRTVKHMLFLRSVSSQAEKLKKSAYTKSKVTKSNSSKSHSHRKGGSWAYQMESQPRICPLIVEDLDEPGHVLIEMLCKEYGLFLEVANIIKGLQLNILKGVLESRSDKLWAHFIIEASRGFHRMHILLPLMQLLQRKEHKLVVPSDQ